MNEGAARRVYFHHIPKTAGTSMTEVIRAGAEGSGRAVLGPALLDDLLRPEYAGWREVDVLIGHLGALPTTVDPGRATVTVLRDPMTHLFSWYRHVRRHPGHYFHRLVVDEDVTFEQWLVDDRFDALTDNPQARHLGWCPPEPRGEFVADAPHRVQQSFELQPRTCSDEELEAAALSTLRRAAVVGVVERFAEVVTHVSSLFGLASFDPPRLNVGDAEPPQLKLSTQKVIAERCAVDIRLHAAVARSTEERVPGAIMCAS